MCLVGIWVLVPSVTTMSMDVDQERIHSDRLEEQVGNLEEELDMERSARVQLTVDLCQALDMCNTWADRVIELCRDVNMLRARIEPIPSSSSSESNMDISDDSSSDGGRGGGTLDSRRAPSWQVSESSNGRGGDNGGAGYNTEFSDSPSEGSGSSLVDAIEDGVVAGDHGVYHVRLEFDLLSPEAIALHHQQLQVAWQAVMDGEGRVVQIGGPVDEPPPPDYDFCPQGRGGVNRLVLIEDEMGGEVLNDVEEIQEAGGPAPDYDDHRTDRFITPPPCAQCASRRRVENGPDGWGDNYVDE